MPSSSCFLLALGQASSISSSASAPSYYQYKHLRLRGATATWGATACLAYSVFSAQQLAQLLFTQAADLSGRRAAAVVDVVFSAALALSAGAVAVCAVWFSPACTRPAVCVMGGVCSLWYSLGLFLPVCRSALEVLTTITFCAAALVHVPLPGLLLGVHAATMSCYFIGVGYSMQTSIMRSLIVHGLGAVVYALMECRYWTRFKAVVRQHQQRHCQQQQQQQEHHQLCRQQQQQQQQEQQDLAQQQPKQSPDQLPQVSASFSPCKELEGPSSAAAIATESTEAWAARKQEAAAALRRAALLQSVPETSQPSASPPLLRHSNSLESSVTRHETETAWASVSPTPFLSLQGWNFKMQREEGRASRHLPWRSASSVSDLGEPLSDTHHAEPPTPPRLAATGAVRLSGSSRSTPPCPTLPVDEQLRVHVRRVHESSSGTGTPATAAASALQGCQPSDVCSTLHPAGSLEGSRRCSTSALMGARQEAWLNSQESAPPPVSGSSIMRGSSDALDPGAEAPAVQGAPKQGAQPNSLPPQPAPSGAVPLLSLLPQQQHQREQQQQQQQSERFSHCMASAWDVGGGFNRDGTPEGDVPAPAPTISAVSPMVTHPADGCIMLRVVGAGLGQAGVELRARMHGMYFPVRMAHVWWSAGEGGPSATANFGFHRPSRSLELMRRSSSDMAGELIHGGSPSRTQHHHCLNSSGHGGDHVVVLHRSNPLSPTHSKSPHVRGLKGKAGQQGGQQQGQGGLESAVITISGLKASSSGSSCSSTFRGLLTLECQVNGTLSSSRPVLVLAEALDGGVESELLAAFAADSCGYTMEALAQEQEAPERMGFNNCSGACSRSDLSDDLLGSRSSLGEVESEEDVQKFQKSGSGSLAQEPQAAEDDGMGRLPGEVEDGDQEGDEKEEEEGEGGDAGDSWMADFVSDLGFWLECIDMLDEQHAAAAESRSINKSGSGGRQGRGLCGKALQEGRTLASSDGPDYTEQLPMLRGHPVPRAVLVMVGTQLLASALEQAMRTLALRLIQGLVKTLGIREEQVCTSVRTVSGGWSVLHCAVRSQDLPTLEVALSLCGPNPTRSWLSDAAPAAPCCTPLHMAAVLPDGGELATAILARNPEVQPLWLGLPLEQPPPGPLLAEQHEQKPMQQIHPLQQQQQQQLQQQARGGALTASTLTSPSTWGIEGGFEGCGTSSSISPGAVSTPGVSIFSSHSCATNRERDSAGGSAGSAALSPAAATNAEMSAKSMAAATETAAKSAAGVAAGAAAAPGSHAGAARVLLDPRPGSPAALAAACGNWVRTAWAQSATLTAPSSMVGGVSGGVNAASAGGAALPSSIQQQQLTTLPASAEVPGAQHVQAFGTPSLRSPTAGPVEVVADDDLLFPVVPILQAPPVSRGGSRGGSMHPSLPNTPSAARATAASADGTSPQLHDAEPTRVPSGALQAFMDAQPAACTLISLVYGVVMWVVAGLAWLASASTAQPLSWLGIDARQLWSWAKLLCFGFGEQEDAVVLGRRGAVEGALGGSAGREESGSARNGAVEDVSHSADSPSGGFGTSLQQVRFNSSGLLEHGVWSEGSQQSESEARYERRFRGILLGQLGVDGGFAWGASMQHVECAWLVLLVARCSAKLCAVLGLCALLPPGSHWPLLMLGLDVTFCMLFPLIAEQVRVRLLAPLLLLEVLLAQYAHSAWALVPADNASMYSSTSCTALQNLVVLVIAVVFERSHRATFLLEQLQQLHRAQQQQQ